MASGAGANADSVASGFLDRLQRDPRWPPLFFEFVAYAARDPEVRTRFGSWARDTRNASAELIELRAEQLGLGQSPPAGQLALAVNALANGMLTEALLDPEGVPAEAFDDFVYLLLSGNPRP